MAIITVKHKGSFKKSEKFFQRTLRREYMPIVRKYAEAGVELLKRATPKDSGVTAESWGYEIEQLEGQTNIIWTNSSSNQGANIAILIIYGHGLENGGYVEGENFVSPAIRPLMRNLADKVWREVTK